MGFLCLFSLVHQLLLMSLILLRNFVYFFLFPPFTTVLKSVFFHFIWARLFYPYPVYQLLKPFIPLSPISVLCVYTVHLRNAAIVQRSRLTYILKDTLAHLSCFYVLWQVSGVL